MLSLPPFPCPICKSQFTAAIIAQEGENVAVRRCPGCGLHITFPRLEAPQHQYMDVTPEWWDRKYGAIDRGEQLIDRHQNYLEEVAVILEFVSQGQLLDVGCNAGWLLGYLQREGGYQLEGVEPSQTLAAIARRRVNAVIHEGYLNEVQGRTYDGIIATDVIEHILPEEVNAFAADMARLLKPGGYIFIKTPNVRFTALKSKLVKWLPSFGKRAMLQATDVWDAKEHVIHWDVANLVRLFRQNGLTPVRVFVPHPVETTGSPLGARIARKLIYRAGQLWGGQRRVPFFAQDMFLVAQKGKSEK